MPNCVNRGEAAGADPVRAAEPLSEAGHHHARVVVLRLQHRPETR